ncbi:hypothetical protein [Azospirillum sp. TSO5]|uniref:hypothetical protein n=1 Tax=Azospirillum sp. TSO5 TaxID=716760 RepID=UPI000D613236|nr:hypothetical protein [Azospirillum sp. TSO5]PWC81952.1 hypothetical protein TSO5_31150 [Azospirillum sp. TSO5]
MAATTTQLTPNSQSVVTMNATNAQVSFQVLPTDVSYWAPQVSSSFTTASLGKNVGNAVVTFNSGLTVTLSAQAGGGYVVLVSGQITDGDTVYTLTGTVIGQYTPPSS